MREREDTTAKWAAGVSDTATGSRSARDYVEVLSGPEDGKVFEIRAPVVTIGRLDDNDICVPLDLSVSRHHARLSRTGTGYSLEVLDGARNPATVNGLPVRSGEACAVARGSTFALGDVLFDLGARPE